MTATRSTRRTPVRRPSSRVPEPGPEPAARRGVAERLDRVGEVLHLIRGERTRTLAQLADATGLARSTVALRVERLAELGLVTHVGARDPQSAATRGRPPIVVRFNPGAGVVLVAHVGLTATRLGVADLAGTIVADGVLVRALDDDPAAHLRAMADRFADLLSAHGGPGAVRGVGVGLPSRIELATGRSEHGLRTAGWLDVDVAAVLSGAFDAPVVIDTDVNVLALGEFRDRQPAEDCLVCVKVGTVIGAGVVVNGHVVHGAQGAAGSIGHTRLAGHDEPCLCGNTGCLDAVAGGSALAAGLRARGVEAEDVRDVARLAQEGVLPAVQAVRQAGRHIGEVLAGVVNLLDPGAISLWGYLVEAEVPLLAGLREGLYSHALPGATRELRLGPSGLGPQAGLRGAAALVLDAVLHPDAVDRLAAGA